MVCQDKKNAEYATLFEHRQNMVLLNDQSQPCCQRPAQAGSRPPQAQPHSPKESSEWEILTSLYYDMENHQAPELQTQITPHGKKTPHVFCLAFCIMLIHITANLFLAPRGGVSRL